MGPPIAPSLLSEPALERFSLQRLAARPWKNGGGQTREIVCWPRAAGLEDFDWRISVATIAASGPFSAFADVDRWIVLLDGDGVRLVGEGIDHRLDQPLQPFAFAGDRALDCQLLGAASSDFNLMLRRGRGQARLDLIDGALDDINTAQGLLLIVDGRAVCTRSQDPTGTLELGAGDGLYWTRAVGRLALATADEPPPSAAGRSDVGPVRSASGASGSGSLRGLLVRFGPDLPP